jgi:hypothetical protein
MVAINTIVGISRPRRSWPDGGRSGSWRRPPCLVWGRRRLESPARGRRAGGQPGRGIQQHERLAGARVVSVAGGGVGPARVDAGARWERLREAGCRILMHCFVVTGTGSPIQS